MNKAADNTYPLSKSDVLDVLLDRFRDDPKIISLAENARAFYLLAKKEGVETSCFPMLGSMGQEASMGLGVALGRRDHERKTVVLSGDGSFLANVNVLTTIAMFAPKNLVVFVLDNEVHGITGGQRTATPVIDLAHMAQDCRMRAHVVRDHEQLVRICDTLRSEEGPHFVQIKVNRAKPPTEPLSDSPSQLFSQFRAYLKKIAG